MRLKFPDDCIKELRELIDRSVCFNRTAMLDEIDTQIAEKDDPLHEAYREAASCMGRDGEIEVDSDAVVSIGGDPGAYVMAWLWVPDEKIQDYLDLNERVEAMNDETRESKLLP